MLFKMPRNTAKKHFSGKTEVQTHTRTHTVWLSPPHVTHSDCPVVFSFHSYCMPPCSLLQLAKLCSFPPLVLHPSLLPVCTTRWLPLTPSRHTHTSSSSSLSLSLISQGSTPVLLLFLLAAYFAPGCSLSPAQRRRFFPFSPILPFSQISIRECRIPHSTQVSSVSNMLLFCLSLSLFPRGFPLLELPPYWSWKVWVDPWPQDLYCLGQQFLVWSSAENWSQDSCQTKTDSLTPIDSPSGRWAISPETGRTGLPPGNEPGRCRHTDERQSDQASTYGAQLYFHSNSVGW